MNPIKYPIRLLCGFAALATCCTTSHAAITTFMHGGHGYAVIFDTAAETGNSRSWNDANTFVSTLTGGSGGIPAGWSSPHLAYINSAAENDTIRDQIVAAGLNSSDAADGGGATYAWIGAVESSEGNYEWGDGTDFWSGGTSGGAVGGNYTNFGSYDGFGPGGPITVNEPDNFTDPFLSPAGQDRIGISTEGWGGSGTAAGEWNDIDSGNTLAFVVEFDVVPEPSSTLLLGLGCAVFLFQRRKD